jgi:formate dehydrogenase subunit gamma
VNRAGLSDIIARYAGRHGVLLVALQEIQDQEGYVPDEAIVLLSTAMGVSVGEVRGVISFYRELRTEPPGRHKVRVCRGDSCAALGSHELAESVERYLGIPAGATNVGGQFTYDIVYCLGNCALSPSVSIDGEVYGRATPERVVRRLEELNGD